MKITEQKSERAFDCINHLNLTEKLGLRTLLISLRLVFPVKVLIGRIGGGAPPVTDLS